MADYTFFGELGRQLESRLAIGGSSAVRVIVSDAFEPKLCGEWNEDRPTILCFATTRGVFVSCRLGAGEPCLDCFERRWMANLELWEHPASLERLLRKVGSHTPEARAFTLPESATATVQALITERLEGPDTPRRCDYVDLLSCERTVGYLSPIHGCRRCFPLSGGDPRYLRGLAAIGERLDKRHD